MSEVGVVGFQSLGLDWWDNGKRELFWRRAWQGLGLGGA